MTIPSCSIHPPQCDVYMRGIVESKTIIRTKYSRKVKAGAHYYALVAIEVKAGPLSIVLCSMPDTGGLWPQCICLPKGCLFDFLARSTAVFFISLKSVWVN